MLILGIIGTCTLHYTTQYSYLQRGRIESIDDGAHNGHDKHCQQCQWHELFPNTLLKYDVALFYFILTMTWLLATIIAHIRGDNFADITSVHGCFENLTIHP